MSDSQTQESNDQGQSNSPEQAIANTIKEAIQEGNEKVEAKIESLQDFQAEKESFKQEIKSYEGKLSNLESEINAIKEKNKESKSADTGEVEYKNFEPLIKSFQDIIRSETKMQNVSKQEGLQGLYNDIGLLETKSVNTFDNSLGGFGMSTPRNLGMIDVNLQTISPVMDYITVVSAGAMTDNNGVAYDTLDIGKVKMFEGLEGRPAKESETPIYDRIKITLGQYKARIPVSDAMTHYQGGMRFNPVMVILEALQKQFEKGIAAKILNGITVESQGINGILPIASGQKRANNIRIVETAASDTLTLTDLHQFGQNLKSEYVNSNSVLLIDKNAYYSITSEEGGDGHLKDEYFIYNNANGAVSLKTPSGAIRLIPVEPEDGFTGYRNFNNPSTTVTEGFQAEGGNGGKAVAILGDLRSGYTLARSTLVEMGADHSLSEKIAQGYIFAGQYSYIGGNVTKAEAIAVLTVKS